MYTYAYIHIYRARISIHYFFLQMRYLSVEICVVAGQRDLCLSARHDKAHLAYLYIYIYFLFFFFFLCVYIYMYIYVCLYLFRVAFFLLGALPTGRNSSRGRKQTPSPCSPRQGASRQPTSERSGPRRHTGGDRPPPPSRLAAGPGSGYGRDDTELRLKG